MIWILHLQCLITLGNVRVLKIMLISINYVKVNAKNLPNNPKPMRNYYWTDIKAQKATVLRSLIHRLG